MSEIDSKKIIEDVIHEMQEEIDELSSKPKHLLIAEIISLRGQVERLRQELTAKHDRSDDSRIAEAVEIAREMIDW